MKKNEEKAWLMLTELERNSLFLTLSNGMSSWEAGEILKISHYKYLELKERSEKFFKLFSDFFGEMGSIFSPTTVVSSRFRDYIDGCIEKRLTRKDAYLYSGDSTMVLTEIRGKVIFDNMILLKKSENINDNLTYKLIMEFDRWNNWRILPRKLQAPSAYKRRNNKRDKVYINYINRIPSDKINALIDIYTYNPRKKTKQCLYIALISSELFDDGYEILKIRNNEPAIEKLSALSIYIFNEYKHAEIFAYLITRYSENSSAKLGQQFWPEYRESISRAINYKEVNNLNFYVNDLDMAYQIKPKRAKKEKSVTHGAKRANLENF